GAVKHEAIALLFVIMNTEEVYLLNTTKSGNYGARENTFTSSFQDTSSDHMTQSADLSHHRPSIHVTDPCTSSNWPRTQSLLALILHMDTFARFVMIIGFLSSIIHEALLTLSNKNNPISNRINSDETLNSTVTIINSQSFLNDSNLIKEFHQLQTMTNLIIALVSMTGITFLSSYLQSLCWQYSFEKQVYTLHQDLFYQLLRQDVNWLWRGQKNGLTNLLEQLECIRNGISLHLGSIVRYSSTCIASLIIGFYVEWRLMCIVLCMPVLITVFSSVIGQCLQKNLNKSIELLVLSKNKIVDALDRIRGISAWMGQKIELVNYKITLQLLLQAEKSVIFYSSINIGIVIFIFYASFALFTWYGAYLISADFEHLNNLHNVKDVYVVIFSALTVIFSITHIAPRCEAIAEADKACSNIFPIIKKVPPIDSYSSKGKVMRDFKGNIQFINVSFSSPSQKTGCGYIHHADFHLKSNTVTAIIASEYCNTSLLKFLLFRLYDPLEGQILFDEHNLKSLNVHWLREEIGIIEETPLFLSDLVIDNILGGLDSIHFDDIVKAAKATFAHDLILSLPQGYATAMNNCSLSAEEKQIISMVRIMLQNPKIVIIEELENYENENRFEAAVNIVGIGRTVLIFSKRVSTLTRANHVLMFQDGWIVADSPFEELSKNANLIKSKNNSCVTTNSDLDDILQRTNSCIKQICPEVLTKNNIETIDFSSVFKFLRYCRSEPFYIFTGIIFAILFGISAPMYAFLLSRIFYAYLSDADTFMKCTIEVSVSFLVLALLSGLVYYLRRYLFEISGARALRKLKTDVFASILHQPPSWFDSDRTHQSNSLSSILTDTTLSSIIDKGIGPFISSIVTIGCGVVFATLYCWPLTFVIMLGLVVCEAINNLWSIQMLRLENKTLDSMYKKQIYIYSLIFALHQSAVYFLYLIIFAMGDHLMKQWFYLPSQIFSCFLFLTVCGVSLTQLTNQWKVWKQIGGAACQLLQFIDDQKNPDCKKHKNGLKPDITGRIVFQNVHLRNELAKLLLTDVSFTVESGQFVALVGKYSGEAVFNLLVRFYEPSSGHVMLDDVHIGVMSIAHLRKNCILVCNPLITPGSLYDNIVYGLDDSHVNPQDVEDAAKKSGVIKFLWSLPEGWNSVLKNGEEIILKPCDQFRVALARCYLRNPKIVLIDNVFDELSEKDIHDIIVLLQSFCKTRTCLVLTANEHILRHCDSKLRRTDDNHSEAQNRKDR
uniref:ABC transmembrane type-1 domain-containing protein n=1 Tax=Strigamia maritima TaxID=126957 RepID=T1J7Z6_STRMM